MLNIEEIQKILPQRPPFLMLDRVLELEPGKKVVAIKNITVNEEFFNGHFPGKPILPGVLIIEAMAQAAILLFYKEGAAVTDKKMAYYLGAVKVKFLNPVSPGDQLKITIEPIKLLSGQGLVSALAQAGDKEVARGEISFSVKEE